MRTIKKYSNRRLYDTEASSYINLESLAELIREGEVVQVVDAKSGEDLTHTVLLQVILETPGLKGLFPPGFLHRIVRYSGSAGPHQAVLQQVGVGMQMLEAQMARFESQFGWMSGGPRGGRASSGVAPAASPPAEADEDQGEPAPAEAPSGSEGDPELDALRARLAALESRLSGEG